MMKDSKKVSDTPAPHSLTGARVRVRQNEGGKWSLCQAGEDGEDGIVESVTALKNLTVAYVAVRNPAGGRLATCGFALKDVEASLAKPAAPKPASKSSATTLSDS